VPLSRFDDPDIQAVARAVNGLWDRLDQQVRLLGESNRRLEEQRRELAEKTAQLEQLATMVLAAQEDERRRIARELHDETMQSVAALIMGLERGLQAMPEDVPHLRAAHQATARLRDLAMRTLDEIRHLALDLRPAVLDDHGLVPAVRWLAQEQTAHSDLEVAVEASGDVPRLPATVETTLFRIVQEALANVVKHAHARHAAIRLHYAGAVVAVEVEDDGIGVPEQLEPPPGHMGLFNMRERASLLGGSCSVAPAPSGTGTLVCAEIPIRPAPAPLAG
jgi:signal transduction histidine kinase